MKDYKATFNPKSFNRLIEVADSVGAEVYIFEGSLLDNAVIYGAEKIKVNRVKPREYMIVREVYLNGWSSELELIMTNSLEKVKEYHDEWQAEQDEWLGDE